MPTDKVQEALGRVAKKLADRNLAVVPVETLKTLLDLAQLSWTLTSDGDPSDEALCAGLQALLWTAPELGLQLLVEWRASTSDPKRLEHLVDGFGLEYVSRPHQSQEDT